MHRLVPMPVAGSAGNDGDEYAAARRLLSDGAHWIGDASLARFDPAGLQALIEDVRQPLHIVRDSYTLATGLACCGDVGFDGDRRDRQDGATLLWLGMLPPLYPEWLGDAGFLADHRVRFPYIAGEMAGGIASPAMVIAMAGAGMLGFLGTAGLSLQRIEAAIDEVERALHGAAASWGANLIHSPSEPDTEEATVDLYLRRGVERVSASAFMRITPSVVRYACTGLSAAQSGAILRRNHLFAKLSRPEIAERFMSPAPSALLDDLVKGGKLTAMEAQLATRVPLACDITVEADSGGHTDNRPLSVLLPMVQALRDRLYARHRYDRPIRVGAAGGLGTPAAVAGAFALGASYVLTGSINQCSIEAATSDLAKAMLAKAGLADVAMAPAADMFELGVKVQVLKRGTLFASRASTLYHLYAQHGSLESIPERTRTELETRIFQRPLTEIWEETRRYWEGRDPREVEKAETDPRHKMALVFRWYLGSANEWAKRGESSRQLDFQIWCGPAIGGFNAWVEGSFLADPARRGVVQIALNLLEGAAVATRAHQLRTYGVAVPAEAFDFRPRPLS